MAYDDERDRVAPYFTSPEFGELEAKPALLPVGWEAATLYHRLKKTLGEGRPRLAAREAAIDVVLERARAILRHNTRPFVTEFHPWQNMPGAELELDRTLEGVSGVVQASDVVVESRTPWQMELVVILDLSLSMTGEKVALTAVAAAVLALTLPTEDLGLVAFDTTAHVLKHLGETLPPRRFVGRVMDFPAQGYTCMEMGLAMGLEVLRRRRRPDAAALLITDGVYNVGWDPLRLAPRFPRLHVIQVGDDPRERGLCERLARSGRGEWLKARGYDDLAEVCRQLVRELSR